MSKPAFKNKLVSNCPLNRIERITVSQLRVLTGTIGNETKKRSSRSIAWQYFGTLHQVHQENNNQNQLIEVDITRVYCKYVVINIDIVA